VKKALESENKYEKLNDLLEGMTGIVFAPENFVAAAKIIKKYSDEKQNLLLKVVTSITHFMVQKTWQPSLQCRQNRKLLREL
jgi:ribosomal protein L10